MTDLPFAERRLALEAFLATEHGNPMILLSPSVADRAAALGWLDIAQT